MPQKAIDDSKRAVDVYACKGGKFIVVWRRGKVEECRRNVFCNPGDLLGVRMNQKVFHKDAEGNILNEVEKPPSQNGGMGISGYQCSWCGKQIFWGTPEDPTNLEARANEHRLTCEQRPVKRKTRVKKVAPSLSQRGIPAEVSPPEGEAQPASPPPPLPEPPAATAARAPGPRKFKVVGGLGTPTPKERTFKKFIVIAS